MKNLFAFTLLAALFVFAGCRKGPEDPAISFKSRNARIENTWLVTSGKVLNVDTTSNGIPNVSGKSEKVVTSEYTIEGNKVTYHYTDVLNGDTKDETTETLNFSVTINIRDNGTFKNSFDGTLTDENGDVNQVQESATGIWNWIYSGKKKVGINFQSDANSTVANIISGQFKIKKLSSSEMMLEKYTRESNVVTNSNTVTTEVTVDQVSLTLAPQ
ncbi:hypothetical protein GC194_01695 [bacterium]|nr:hypothetical protein [bacterium]